MKQFINNILSISLVIKKKGNENFSFNVSYKIKVSAFLCKICVDISIFDYFLDLFEKNTIRKTGQMGGYAKQAMLIKSVQMIYLRIE